MEKARELAIEKPCELAMEQPREIATEDAMNKPRNNPEITTKAPVNKRTRP